MRSRNPRTLRWRIGILYLLMVVTLSVAAGLIVFEMALPDREVLIGIVFFGYLLLGLFGAFFFGSFLYRFENLIDGTRRLASGERNIKFKGRQTAPGRGDEIEHLAVWMNAIDARLEDNLRAIHLLGEEIHTELEVGKEVQDLLMGNAPAFPDMQLFSYYRPLRAVSGDVYKFYELANGDRALFMGDATGHGVSAALITSVMILTLDYILPGATESLNVTRVLNNFLEERLTPLYFSTGLLIIFEQQQDQIRLCNAGHLPLYIYRHEKRAVEEIESSGPPLGLIKDFPYKEMIVPVSSGDKLLLFSDGIEEALDRGGRPYTISRAVRVFAENAHMDNRKIGDRLKLDFLDHAASFNDDATFLVLQIP